MQKAEEVERRWNVFHIVASVFKKNVKSTTIEGIHGRSFLGGLGLLIRRGFLLKAGRHFQTS